MLSDPPLSDVLERLERAEQLKLNGAHQEALVILEELLLEDPENVSALEEIADNELSLGRFDRAETAARRAILLDAESYTGHYILGFLHSRGEDWTSASTSLRKANALKPNNAEILRCLGWALFSGGQRAQGIVTLERALNLDAESTLVLCDLGVAYLQAQNFPKAKTLFLHALNLEPNNQRAQECLQAVERLAKLAQDIKPREKARK
ncbi:tetratricopeptide repeat protein [Candidatus Peregrinibacteria bacterium]|nr:tetratricopeptide repeat protein [Candidatus Peregrinibacteria bacterium]